jgi:hypothetical protein
VTDRDVPFDEPVHAASAARTANTASVRARALRVCSLPGSATAGRLAPSVVGRTERGRPVTEL